MTKRLWDKGENVDQRMQFLTVGDDPVIDRRLVAYDALGSAAHARMLGSQGILTAEESKQLLTALKKIHALGREQKFDVPEELEDVHTAIEAALQAECGEVGKRIHAARSRNDQVCLVMRLYLREQVAVLLQELIATLDLLEARFEELKDVPMPGYTHLQPAMPSSAALWLHAYYEGLLESVRDGLELFNSINICPLGSGAGFGTNLPIDRKRVSDLLAFRAVQRSVIDVNNSRGRFEEKVLHWCVMLGALLEKWACDLLLFCTHEFGFASLPNELTTGSSIMPQKRNPDLLELLRARPSRLRGALQELSSVTSKLPSSYHRDLQYTKAPVIRGIEELHCCLEMFSLSVKGFQLNVEKLKAAMYPELYATFYANNKVLKGVSFRDAYKETASMIGAKQLAEFESCKKDFQVIQNNCLKDMQEAIAEKVSLAPQVLACRQSLQNAERLVFF